MGERWQLFPKWPRTGVTGSHVKHRGVGHISLLSTEGAQVTQEAPQ